MINLIKLTSIGVVVLMAQNLRAQEFSYEQMNILRNDKEPLISVFSKREKQKISDKYKDSPDNQKLERVFYNTILNNLNNVRYNCDLNVANGLVKNLEKDGFKSDVVSVEEYLKALRVNNSIDDILYKVMSFANRDLNNLKKLDYTKKAKFYKVKKELADNNDLKELFAGFTEFPNDLDRCTFQEFYFIKTNIKIGETKKSTKDKDMKVLIAAAHKQNIISLRTYHTMMYILEDAQLKKRDLWLDDYLRISWRAKNRLVSKKKPYVVKDIEQENDFSSERVKRFSKMTRRQQLYRKYDETQIILLTQVLQKASRRMGIDPDTKSSIPVIMQEFWVDKEDGTQENYVEKIELDAQAQYNLARRLLRRDMTKLQMMETFHSKVVTFEDIVVASLETGYVSLDDIEYVVKYDDLWNPERSKFERISGFVFNVAGYSTFFLPPPWNITATIALGVAEGLLEKKYTDGENNDNPAALFK